MSTRTHLGRGQSSGIFYFFFLYFGVRSRYGSTVTVVADALRSIVTHRSRPGAALDVVDVVVVENTQVLTRLLYTYNVVGTLSPGYRLYEKNRVFLQPSRREPSLSVSLWPRRRKKICSYLQNAYSQLIHSSIYTYIYYIIVPIPRWKWIFFFCIKVLFCVKVSVSNVFYECNII